MEEFFEVRKQCSPQPVMVARFMRLEDALRFVLRNRSTGRFEIILPDGQPFTGAVQSGATHEDPELEGVPQSERPTNPSFAAVRPGEEN